MTGSSEEPKESVSCCLRSLSPLCVFVSASLHQRFFLSGFSNLLSCVFILSLPLTLRAPSRNLYWTDWNRDSPKIETSYMDGTNRRVLVQDDLGLPNGLTFDVYSSQLCWVDAGDSGGAVLFPFNQTVTVTHGEPARLYIRRTR